MNFFEMIHQVLSFVRQLHTYSIVTLGSSYLTLNFKDYNNIIDGIFPHFTTPSIKITIGQKELEKFLKSLDGPQYSVSHISIHPPDYSGNQGNHQNFEKILVNLL